MKKNQPMPEDIRNKYKIPETASLFGKNPIQKNVDELLKELEEQMQRGREERLIVEFKGMLKVGLEQRINASPERINDIINTIMQNVGKEKIKKFVDSTQNGFNNVVEEIINIVENVIYKEETPEEKAKRLIYEQSSQGKADNYTRNKKNDKTR